MADQQAPRAISAPFPAPPPFWKHFTAENLSRLEAITKVAASTKDAELPQNNRKELPPSELRALEIPQDLSYLIPPPPPAGESYTVFREDINLTSTLPPLFQQGLTQLYHGDPIPTNPAPHLLLLTKSLLLNFLELTTTLSKAPSESTEKIEDIRTLYLNIHHVINLYRPHQARETLARMLEDKVEEGKLELREMERWEEQVGAWLGEAGRIGKESRSQIVDGEEGAGINGNGNGNGNKQFRGTADGTDQDTKRIWEMIREVEMGEGE